MTDNIDRYADYLIRNRGVQLDRMQTSRRILRRIEREIGGPVEDITVPAWRGYAAGREIAPSTLSKEFRILRSYLHWVIGEGHMSAAQTLSLLRGEVPKAIDEPRPYSRQEIALLWGDIERAYPDPSDRSMGWWDRKHTNWRQVWRYFRRRQLTAQVLLGLHAGLRPAEIMRVSLDDAHPDNEYLVVRGANKGRRVDGEFRTREVPITDPLRYALAEWLDARERMRPPNDALWLWCRNRLIFDWSLEKGSPASPLPRRGFTESLSKELARPWEWYRLRHTCATEWLRAGMPLEVVSKLLGHASIEQTLTYAKIVGDDVRAAASKHEQKFIAATMPKGFGETAIETEAA